MYNGRCNKPKGDQDINIVYQDLNIKKERKWIFIWSVLMSVKSFEGNKQYK